MNVTSVSEHIRNMLYSLHTQLLQFIDKIKWAKMYQAVVINFHIYASTT